MSLGKIATVALLAAALAAADKRVVFPEGAKPVGPYSPGILAGGFLYVSGQGARDHAGRLPATFEAQARQCLANVKSVVEAAGLTMEHVVYSHVYLSDLANQAVLEDLWREYFPSRPPARAVVGVARMPTDTPIEINAVAVEALGEKKWIAEGVVEARGRVFVGEQLGSGPRAVRDALESLGRALALAGLDFRHLVFVNPYLTAAVSVEEMNRHYAPRFEFGNTPARATIRLTGLPGGASVSFTGVAVRALAARRAVRPKNMRPSPTASPCVFAGQTLYCSAKSGFIPGPNGGIFAGDVELQLRQVMRNLLDGLEEAGLDFSHVVAANVYLDDINDFAKMNRIYALYFKEAPPARTTVQPAPPVERKPDAEGRWPKLVEISLIAVK